MHILIILIMSHIQWRELSCSENQNNLEIGWSYKISATNCTLKILFKQTDQTNHVTTSYTLVTTYTDMEEFKKEISKLA